MAFASQRMIVNGTGLNVVIEGQGPPVLLVHGFPDCHDVWRRQIPVLAAAGFQVIAPDMRGCGESDMAERVPDYAVGNLVADLVGLLDALDIERVFLVGHDWGALISWHLVVSHPERVIRYVAISVGHPGAYARAGMLQKIKAYYVVLLLMRGVAEYVVRQGNWLPLRLMTGYPEEFPRWRASLSRAGRFTAAANYYRANTSMLKQKSYPRIRVPVFGVWSSGDIFLTEKQMKDSGTYLDGPWRYANIPAANHWIPLSASRQLNDLLLPYFGGANGDGNSIGAA